ncbi:type IV pilus inner membrane component PilO [Desulfotalea psychrophila]|nr:type 4a pilus biogenesis protein PilO [Desulfotalea psychrophila]
MNINSTSLTSFLDKKYIPLQPRVKIAIAVAILTIPLLAFIFLYSLPNNEKITRLQQQEKNTQQTVTVAKNKAANLAKFQKEVEATTLDFETQAALLPKEKEIPKLLKDISALGSNTGLDFISFKPLANRPKDFYAEIPISIQVRGPYHNVGSFFDQINKLERIVSVKSVKMTSPKKEDGEMLLTSNCQLVTYQFTNIELPKKQKK